MTRMNTCATRIDSGLSGRLLLLLLQLGSLYPIGGLHHLNASIQSRYQSLYPIGGFYPILYPCTIR